MKNRKINGWFIVMYVMAAALTIIGIVMCGKNDMVMGPIVLACGVITFIRTTKDIKAMKK